MKYWAIILFAVCSASAQVAYPLKLSAGKHYLVDQNGTPTFLQGEGAYSMIAQLSGPQADQYLSNRWTKGFNCALVNLIEHQFTTVHPAPANAYNVKPFTGLISGTWYDFSTINADYFTNVDYQLLRASNYNVCLFVFPAYLGFGGGSEGWYADMTHNSLTSLTNWGKYVAGRYMNFPNIVWVGGGDYNAADKTGIDAVMYGILSVDSNHIVCAHSARNHSGLTDYTESWDLFNSTYTANITASQTLTDYQRSPVSPTFMIESDYNGENSATALTCREEAWQTVFSGAMGNFFGQTATWQFTSGYLTELDNSASTSITNLVKLLRTKSWWLGVPDTNSSVFTSGRGTGGISSQGYISGLRATDGTFVLAYFPDGVSTPTIDMSKLQAQVSASWFNCRDGSSSNFASYANSGSRTFTAPDSNDWVLVLDAPTVATTFTKTYGAGKHGTGTR